MGLILTSTQKKNKMHGKLDLLAVWIFSFVSFMTMNNLVGIFAIVASITSILRNLPYIKGSISKFINDMKNTPNEEL
jgi:amino acid transporter